jgi:hypothetical protein
MIGLASVRSSNVAAQFVAELRSLAADVTTAKPDLSQSQISFGTVCGILEGGLASNNLAQQVVIAGGVGVLGIVINWWHRKKQDKGWSELRARSVQKREWRKEEGDGDESFVGADDGGSGEETAWGCSEDIDPQVLLEFLGDLNKQG